MVQACADLEGVPGGEVQDRPPPGPRKIKKINLHGKIIENTVRAPSSRQTLLLIPRTPPPEKILDPRMVQVGYLRTLG